MPEHTLPDALHPQQEDAADELQLRGGLKGRFFADFCLLQSTVDALQNYLVHAATPDVQDMAAPLLEEMKQRIFRLERLADNAGGSCGAKPAAPAVELDCAGNDGVPGSAV